MHILLNNIIPFQIILPIFAALLSIFIKKHARLSIFITIFFCLISLANATYIFCKIQKIGVMFYEYGSWPALIGVEHSLSLMGASVNLLVSFIAAGLSFLLINHLKSGSQISLEKIPVFNSMFLICLAGMSGMVLTNDIFNFYVFLEITSLSSYALVASINCKRAAFASMNYLIMGTISASFILLGIGVIYMMTGNLNMTELQQKIPEIVELKTTMLAVIFLVIGFLIKIAIFPLHGWLVEVYRFSPSFVVSFFSGTMGKVMIYGMIKFFYFVFNLNILQKITILEEFLILLGVISLIYSAILAYRSQDLKQILAFSSVSQMSLIMLVVVLDSQIALGSFLLLMINHSLAKTSLFIAAGAIERKFGSTKLSQMRLVARHMPKTSFIILLNLLSLIGFPVTFGFVAKWDLFHVTIASAIFSQVNLYEYLTVGVLVISSFFTLLYAIKIIETIYFKDNKEKITIRKEAGHLTLAVMFFFSAVNLLFIFYSRDFINLSKLVSNNFG